VVPSQTSETINIFFSLAPQDNNLFEELRKHLMILKRQGLIDMYYDSMISAGSDVIGAIQSFIRTADIIVLLISADFFASDQCFEIEMSCALEEHAIRAAHVITVLLRPTAWIGFPLVQHALLPPNGKAVSIWNDLDMALTEVAKGIYRVIEELAHGLASVHKPVKPPQFPLFTLPHRRNPFFTDRDDTLAELHRHFTSQQTPHTRTQALYGLGGIGKTLLAIEYAYRYQHEYQAVLWLHATPRTLFSSDILSLAHQLGIPAQDEVDERQRIAAIQRWLQRHERWLLVLDNLEDYHLLKQLVPLESNGHVLLITHFQTAEPFANTVPVTPLTGEEGALLLLRRSGIIPGRSSHDVASEEDYLHAMTLAQEVEGYPLALDQAGAYIEETQQSLASYLRRYREQQARFLGKRGRLATDHPDPVTTTLSLTFARIAQLDPHALELLRFFAFLSPEALPHEMLRDGASVLSDPLHTLAVNPLAFEAALSTLLRFSLVQRRTDSTSLNMHRIIQIILRKQLTKKQQLQLAKQAVRLINTVFPEVRFATRNVCERYISQAQHCATLIHDFQLTLPEGNSLLERLGSYYSQHGCYAQAEMYLTQALHLQQQRLRSNPADTAQILNALGLLSQRQAHYQDAEVYHQRALKLRQRLLGPEHPKTAESLHNLALLYGDQGEYQQAEQFYQHVIALEERAKGLNHSDVARTLNNLALMYYHQGRYPQAETTYHRALAIYQRSLPADHPDLIYLLDGLGALAEIQGNYQQAEQFYQQAFAICEHAFGERHPETAHCLNKLADISELKGNYQEAETFYLQALSIGERVLGPEHPDIALFLNNLAFLVQRQGQYQRAEELYQRSLNIYERTLGPKHPDVASVLNNQGKLFRDMNNEERAEKLLRRALAIDEERLNPTHPDIAQNLSDLADLLIEQHRYEEAEPLFHRALAILLQTADSEHSEATLVREKYAALLERMNRSEEAARLRLEAQKQEGQQSTEPPQGNH
jgi:tetratricopeptide (TPR) repeat protein